MEKNINEKDLENVSGGKISKPLGKDILNIQPIPNKPKDDYTYVTACPECGSSDFSRKTYCGNGCVVGISCTCNKCGEHFSGRIKK